MPPVASYAEWTWEVPAGSPSLAYICATCGEVWARISVEPAVRWAVIHRACPRHAPAFVLEWAYPPGSLSIPAAWHFEAPVGAMRGWPAGLLRRELEIYLDYFDDKEIEG